MSEEPTVLDYVKSLLTPWKGRTIRFPGESPVVETTPGEPESRDEAQPVAAQHTQEHPEVETGLAPVPPDETPGRIAWPWRSLAALCMALAGQMAFEPPERSLATGLFFYGLAAALLLWGVWRGEWRMAPLQSDQTANDDPQTVRRNTLIIGGVLAVLAYILFGGNQFHWLNVYVWLLALFFVVRGFWLSTPRVGKPFERLLVLTRQPFWTVQISRWALVMLALIAIVAFFRLYRLDSVPPQMFSDHAEKLFDVYDVMHGETRIFFPRNTGREFFQFYLTAAIMLVFNTGYSFLSLKIGTTIAGLVTLVYVYLLGGELANRRVGLLAALFAGIAYWPNVITRVGLRFALYPLFAAPALYYLVRGVRRRNRNDFILSGLFLGLGLHGYTSFRIVPLLIVVAIILYLLHASSRGYRRQAVYNLIVLALIASMVFIPLFRFMASDPDSFAFRAMTRLGSVERPLPGSPVTIFLQNLWNAVTMFAWNNGQIWVHSVTGRPALDIVSGALFHLGVLLVGIRYVRQRHWLDLFLLLSIPFLMLPSILSLAFPAENPALNRAAGAFIPVFLIVALALDGLLSTLEKMLTARRGVLIASGLLVLLVGWSMAHNYELVFVQYQRNFSLNSWNTREIGRVVEGFTASIGRPEDAYALPYPHWIDTRLPALTAGIPNRDMAITLELIPFLEQSSYPRLFLLNVSDRDGLAALERRFPDGNLSLVDSELAGKDFYIFLAPPDFSELEGMPEAAPLEPNVVTPP
jgi:4-amino-4-deoxy-L-arabinose transferase-like glycosyltransferase